MNRSSSAVLACLGVALAVACDSGSDLVGVGRTEAVPLALAPVFAVAPSAEEIAALDLLRVRLLDGRDSSLVQAADIVIDPDDDEWTLEMTVEIPAGRTSSVSFFVETELADTQGGIESVEWSGRTQAFPLRSPDRPLEFRQVDLYRGPIANLGLSRVAFTRTSLELVEGSTAFVQWLTEGDTVGTRLYLSVADESIVSVDQTGALETRGIGATKVFVYGGQVEDSLTLEVTEIFLPRTDEVQSQIEPPLDYAISDLFMSTFHDPSAESIRDPLRTLSTSLESRDGPAVIEAFEAAKAAWRAYGSGTTLRYADGPQLGVLELTLQRVADGLHTAFP